MAKFVIRGDNSGEVTLDAPAVAGSSTITIPDANGTVLCDGTAVTVAQGGTGTTSFTAYGVVCGGATSTDPLQSIDPGTSGQVLASGGAGALPSFQSISSLVTEITVTKIIATGAGTWTVPSTGTYALVRCWGGGGSGGRGGATQGRAGGGGGGGYAERYYKLSDLGTPGTNVSYYVGAGGAAKVAAGAGSVGANTFFAGTTANTVAYGGGAGFGNSNNPGGGGGGGALGSGGNGSEVTVGTGGACGGGDGAASTTLPTVGTNPWGGGGGGTRSNGTVGANAFLGGGGGGGGNSGSGAISGGTSIFGGNGGNGGDGTTPSTSGAQPGGGGGGQGQNGGSSGKGGDGMIEIWVW